MSKFLSLIALLFLLSVSCVTAVDIPPGKATLPMPWNGMTAVNTDVGTLKWRPGNLAVSGEVYFGTKATPTASEFKGNQTSTTFNPGPLSAGVTYYWRVDQVNSQGTKTTGDVWRFTTPITGANRVKIFILAGQSNMVGHGQIEPINTPGTLRYIFNKNPTKYAHLRSGNQWVVRNDTWIFYDNPEVGSIQTGGLAPGYGASEGEMGPELQFGHAMGDHFGQKVLLIKTAWGGRSLAFDFRPPSSDPNPNWTRDGKPYPVPGPESPGVYFKAILAQVIDATSNLKTYFPDYNSADGFEIVGFGWHQGFNDHIEEGWSPDYAAEYEVNMANFIKDIRASLGIPKLPFVIATCGQATGPIDKGVVERAQLKMNDFVKYPEFSGNVAAIDTDPFWRDITQSPADEGYHWNLNAESYYLIGESMGAVMLKLINNSATPIKPTITTQPANRAVTVGATATFTVVATGTPAPTYQWRKGGTNIVGATNASYTTPVTVIGDNGALFSVVVTNSAGSVTSNNATLTVNATNTAPTITTQPANRTVAVGATATFTVMATGTPSPTYQWRSKGGTNIVGATNTSYTTPATVIGDNGALFSVVVTNSAGTVTSNNATLTVNAVGGGTDVGGGGGGGGSSCGLGSGSLVGSFLMMGLTMLLRRNSRYRVSATNAAGKFAAVVANATTSTSTGGGIDGGS